MDDKLDFLDGPEPAEPPTADLTNAEPTPDPSLDGQPRGPDGKFVAKDGAPAAEPPPPAEPVQAEAPPPAPAPAQPEAPAAPPPGFVPVSVVQELRNEIRSLKQQPPPQPQYAPQDFEPEELTPEAYVQQQALNTRLDLSEELARDKFGDETVDQARDWALQKYQSNPAFKAEVLSQRNPYRYVVEAFKADQRAAKLNDLADDDIEQFLAWKAQRAAPAPQPAAAPAAPPPQPTPPPRSLASAPNAGGAKPGEQPVGPGVAFDSLFTR